MTDPTRSRIKGRGKSIRDPASDSGTGSPRQPDAGNSIYVSPRNGAPGFSVDLSELCEGRNQSAVHTWKGRLPPRPKLLQEMVPTLEELYGHATKSGWASLRTVLRALWRALDELPEGFRVDSVSDLTDAHGELLRRLASAHRSYYFTWARVLVSAANQKDSRSLNWPAAHDAEREAIQDLSDRVARRILTAFKSELRDIKLVWKQGDALLAGDGSVAAWVPDEAAERLRGFFSAHADPVPSRASAIGALRKGIVVPAFRPAGVSGPSDVGREATPEPALESDSVRDALRWRYPFAAETSCFFLAFLIRTGWNADTAKNIDLTKRWWRPHPLSEDIVVIYSTKGKTGTVQTAISLRGAEFHAFQIIQTIKQCTAPLRRELKRRIRALEEELEEAKDGRRALEERLGALRFARRSPWLYVNGSDFSEVGCFYPWEPLKFPGVILRAVVAKYGIRTDQGALVRVQPRDFRNVWIGFAFAQSGHNWLAAKMAAGHRSVASLRDYLRRRRWRAFSEERISLLFDALWSEVRGRRLVDATVLRQLIQSGSITESQRRRLADHRNRTRIGVGCLEPLDPPKDVAPNHPAALECMVQRCVICSRALIFKESLDGLCCRLAELRHLKTHVMSATAWLQSSFADEEEVLELNLTALFDESEVHAAVGAWAGRIASGEHVVFDALGYWGRDSGIEE